MGVKVRALLFDFDGLLLDTETVEFISWSEVYERHGQRLRLRSWAAGIGTVNGFDPRADLAKLGVRLDDEDMKAQHLRTLELCALAQLRPGVTALLREAERRGLSTAIVSSSSREWIVGHLARCRLLESFGTIICADRDAARAKPRPTLYLEALEKLSVRAYEAVAFEDSPNGIAAARAAAVFCVAVPNPITQFLDLSGANTTLSSLQAIDLDVLLG